MILARRLDDWAEGQGLRATGQAGFRKGMRTLDQIFVVPHIFDKYKLNEKLFCCFVEFSKAYDLVD